MPANLDEAFKTSLDNSSLFFGTNSDDNNTNDTTSSMENIKNPYYKDFSQEQPIQEQNWDLRDVGNKSSDSRNCSVYLNHIWKCPDCRTKLKDLMGSSGESIGTVSNTALTPIFNLFSSEQLPNLIYYMLVGLGIIIVLDYFVQIGRKK